MPCITYCYRGIIKGHGNIFHVTGPLWGESTGHRWIPLTKASDAELWCLLWSAWKKRLGKQSRRRWFETISPSLWRHYNVSNITTPAWHWHLWFHYLKSNAGPNYSHSRLHDDVIKWKHFPRYGPFLRGIHRSPVNYPHKGQWRGALMLALICVWINGWVNNREAGDLRRHRAHYDVIVIIPVIAWFRYLLSL